MTPRSIGFATVTVGGGGGPPPGGWLCPQAASSGASRTMAAASREYGSVNHGTFAASKSLMLQCGKI